MPSIALPPPAHATSWLKPDSQQSCPRTIANRREIAVLVKHHRGVAENLATTWSSSPRPHYLLDQPQRARPVPRPPVTGRMGCARRCAQCAALLYCFCHYSRRGSRRAPPCFCHSWSAPEVMGHYSGAHQTCLKVPCVCHSGRHSVTRETNSRMPAGMSVSPYPRTFHGYRAGPSASATPGATPLLGASLRPGGRCS